MEKYCNEICTKSRKFFEHYVQTNDPKTPNLMNMSLKETRKFFYVNIYNNFWNNAQIEKAFDEMSLKCKDDFDSLFSQNKYSYYLKEG